MWNRRTLPFETHVGFARVILKIDLDRNRNSAHQIHIRTPIPPPSFKDELPVDPHLRRILHFGVKLIRLGNRRSDPSGPSRRKIRRHLWARSTASPTEVRCEIGPAQGQVRELQVREVIALPTRLSGRPSDRLGQIEPGELRLQIHAERQSRIGIPHKIDPDVRTLALRAESEAAVVPVRILLIASGVHDQIRTFIQNRARRRI